MPHRGHEAELGHDRGRQEGEARESRHPANDVGGETRAEERQEVGLDVVKAFRNRRT